MESVKLSVLDVGLIRTNQSAANAFSSMISLAQHAEKLGYHRYWLGEHHNVAGVVASQTGWVNITMLPELSRVKRPSLLLRSAHIPRKSASVACQDPIHSPGSARRIGSQRRRARWLAAPAVSR
jgi:hypothetical protein